MLALITANVSTAAPIKLKADIETGQICVECHTEESPGIVTEWKKSTHATEKVDCYDCHKGYITAAPFDEKIKWTWFEIWHHKGRRARHGAAMNGPDYTWWHGMYEVGQNTYFKWIPELRDVVRKKDGNEKFADELLVKYFKPIQGHDWYFNGINKDTIEKVRKGFEERYGKDAH